MLPSDSKPAITMGRLLLLIVLSAISLSSCPQKAKIKFTIKGKVLNADKSTTIKFSGEEVYKTTLNPDKSFEIKGTLPEPGTMLFFTDNSFAWALWVAEGDIDLTLEEYYLPTSDTTKKRYMRIVSASGSPETVADYQLGQRWNELIKTYAKVPKEALQDSLVNAIYPEILKYVAANPANRLSAVLPGGYPLTHDQRKQLLDLLDRNAYPGDIERIEQELRRSALLKPGTVIPDWKQNTLDGSQFSLYSVKADYILLEFWASDCLPCRQSNPALIKIFDAYHSKGFEIVGISLDVKKKNWQKAIEKDKLPWVQVSDLKGWKNKISAAYEINSIPFNILLNRKYEVIAVNLPPQPLADKLKELTSTTE